MTTGDKSRVVDHATGVVASANARGLKLAGEQDYRNFSRYADPPIAPPARGEHVRLGLDSSGFIRELEVLGTTPAAPSPSTRDETITRLACLKAAATFCAGKALNTEVSTADVLKVATAFEKWVTKGADEQA
jgi:hypothetical protein